jgi:putative FmdB family regulatory protein
MPIYEYRCEACGAPKEAIQKMSEAPLRTCDACGAEALVRLMSRTSFVLKGSGWYATDYKPAPKSDAAGDRKVESKPESTPEAKAATAKAEGSSSGSAPSRS